MVSSNSRPAEVIWSYDRAELIADGIVHAIGQALYERVHYDEDGQLVTGTFVDYALPTAAEIPSFETDRTVTPSPVNSMGVKGVEIGRAHV